ncbi:hypothetical protein PRK78_005579 [Emydomyces testavorans]|uniref:Sodium/calcium exchanger membrane region domain-containing protein n=1 Tax=Emydomyces testavorans TaxID=2070801 RepID=A0AAF0DKT0_9EURO|nr:hypothetical protein PRK78_005579 [Emydomyces testavorans]
MDSFLESVLSRASATRKSRRRYSSRPFYLVLIVLLALAAVTVFIPRPGGRALSPETLHSQRQLAIERRGLSNIAANKQDAKDQCAHVLANCADHEVGLLSYLQLYYCKLPNAKPVAFVILALWLSLLFSTIGIAASDFLCVNLSTIASILGMSESLTGVTFLAFGNGSPDVFSTFAAMSSNSGSLAIGELIGAAGFISAVVAGSMALVRPFRVARRSFIRDIAFFTCSASFSLVFIADGKLHMWECIIMIVFYLFYVVVVVIWHWYLGRQRQRLERDLMARAQFHIPQNQELDIQEMPEDEDAPVARGQHPLFLGPSDDDFDALERADIPTWRIEEEEDDETRDRYLAELQENMRVSRPSARRRGTTMGPIRPSLVGALEFRSVLSALERSRSFHSGRIHLRSYSDDVSHPGMPSVPGRARAVSANPPTRAHLHHTQQNETASESGVPISRPQRVENGNLLFASPTSSRYPSRSHSPIPRERGGSPNFLAPPGGPFRLPSYGTQRGDVQTGETSTLISPQSPGAKYAYAASSSSVNSSKPHSPTTPFPPYRDDELSVRSETPSIRFPPTSISARSVCTPDRFHEERRLAWWPYRYLPSPSLLICTLFPTLSGWGEKSMWGKFLGITAAPSVLLLTITLPVAESPEVESESESSPPLIASLLDENTTTDPSDTLLSGPSDVDTVTHLDRSTLNDQRNTQQPTLTVPPVSRHRHDSEAPLLPKQLEQNSSAPKQWNRWLLTLQLLTAPFFITLTAWANLDSDMNPRNLLIPTLISLLVSVVFLATLILTTKPTTNQLPSRARPFLAFLGFVVSIAWISTLATEVVNLLKSIGVILSISDSLLGLTIFAIGNSLGDLVADVTVARLGYPVMALSACFGGPMLNILIGIGVGGLYMTLHSTTKQQQQQHASASASVPLGLKAVVARTLSAAAQDPYRIYVSKSLLISGATLLATLVGLLIVVPLNGWRMDRKIGVGLVTLWCVSTVCNVVVEVVS